MLVLSRKDGQSIHIGPDIVVKISQVSGNRVKVAIDAPRDVAIRRSELAEVSPDRQGNQMMHGELQLRSAS